MDALTSPASAPQPIKQEDYLPTPVTPASAFPTTVLPALQPPTSTTEISNSHHSHPSHPVSAHPTPASSTTPPSKSPTAAAGEGVAAAGRPANPKTNTDEDNHSGATNKPFACHECDQTFSRPHNLKSHQATHSSERPFQCEVCLHHFRRQHDLKRHQKLHTGERPYVCKTCSRSFARLDALNRHQRAEGASACGAAATHNQTRKQGDRPQPTTKSTTTETTTTTAPRRPIPQLHIPFPASQPLPGQVYPCPPSSHALTPSRPAPKQQQQQPQSQQRLSPPPILPSPSTLSSLPVSESSSLVPLHTPTSTVASPSSATTPTALSPHHHNNHNHHHLHHLHHDRHLPPPFSTSGSISAANSPSGRPSQPILDELHALKQRVHDLEVENKVLRSIILESHADRQSPHKRPRSSSP